MMNASLESIANHSAVNYTTQKSYTTNYATQESSKLHGLALLFGAGLLFSAIAHPSYWESRP